jgi:hypothetical protein
MKILNPSEAEQVNERFNHFHDGLLHRIELVRGTHVMEVTEPDGTVELEEFPDGTFVNLDIIHSNYDYPNQPKNRLVRIKAASCINVLASFAEFLDIDIFDLTFSSEKEGISCLLTYHTDDVRNVRSMKNGTQTQLFIARSVEIEELLYDQQGV